MPKCLFERIECPQPMNVTLGDTFLGYMDSYVPKHGEKWPRCSSFVMCHVGVVSLQRLIATTAHEAPCHAP